jgi:hypothetical protein
LDVPDDEAAVSRPTAHYPPADITPVEFEEFVVELLKWVEPALGGLTVTLHDKIACADGTYDFDATVRFELAGMQFLVIVEAKRHKNPIKRELVQVLHQKLQSVGAQKAAMISTAPYQRGAVDFAMTHGIALATVTEGRFMFETRAAESSQPMSRAEAFEQFGVPTYVGHCYEPGSAPGSISTTLLSPQYPHNIVKMLTGQPVPNH